MQRIDLNDLPSLDNFAESFDNKYLNSVVPMYQIVRDLALKQEVYDIKLIDGDKYGRNEYMMHCTVRSNEQKRIYLPLSINGDIDIIWLRQFSSQCTFTSTELYLCIIAPDSIIYEMITTELP